MAEALVAPPPPPTLRAACPLTLQQLGALDAALRAIRAEVIRGACKHGGRSFASLHEGYGVVLEELDETWDEIKANNTAAAIEEVTQVGAVAAFFIMSFTKEVARG